LQKAYKQLFSGALKMIKLIINIFILVLIILFQSFTRKKKIVKCKENPDIIIQNAIHELLLSENESQIHICGKGKPYEYIVEYFDDIHANTGENGQDICTLLREYFRIVLRITDLRSLTIDKRHMKVKAGKQRTALTH